jgi:hypothetical protein
MEYDADRFAMEHVVSVLDACEVFALIPHIYNLSVPPCEYQSNLLCESNY